MYGRKLRIHTHTHKVERQREQILKVQKRFYTKMSQTAIMWCFWSPEQCRQSLAEVLRACFNRVPQLVQPRSEGGQITKQQVPPKGRHLNGPRGLLLIHRNTNHYREQLDWAAVKSTSGYFYTRVSSSLLPVSLTISMIMIQIHRWMWNPCTLYAVKYSTGSSCLK